MNDDKTHGKIPYMVAGLLGCFLLIGLDQWTKHLAVVYLKNQPSIPLISGVLELQYLENRGAAFGIMQNQQWFFLAICAVAVPAALYAYSVLPKTRRMLPLHVLLVLAVSGGIGNAIDRIVHGYVIDFIYFSLIDFPIFNAADCYVVVFGIFLIIFGFFYYKEEDFAFLEKRRGA